MNIVNALSGQINTSLRAIVIVIAVFALSSCKDDSPQSPGTTKTEVKPTTTQSSTLSRLTYTNDSAPFDYQKRMLAEGKGIRQHEYVLFEAGGIAVDDEGKLSFSATGPGFTTNVKSSTAATVTVEKPIHVEIAGTIDLDKYALAATKGKGTTVIGKATYRHSLEGSKKATFSRGDYEMSEYTQNVERELEILYNANRGNIVLSSKGAFEVKKIGTGTTSYSGEMETSEYLSSGTMDLYLEFSID